MNARRFVDRSIIVTAGASGIGRAAALAFADEGGLVTVADIDETRGVTLVSEIKAAGGVAQFIHTDGTSEESIASMVEKAVTAYGVVRHAFNNIGSTRSGSIETLSKKDWDWTLAMSVTATFLSMKYEIPVMLTNGGGTIVNTASTSGKFYTPLASPAYSAAKAGVVQLSHYASCAHGAAGIRVNSVSPGLTSTPMVTEMLSADEQRAITKELHVIQRMVAPEEVAATVLFLSSDQAAMITGHDIEVCGGRR